MSCTFTSFNKQNWLLEVDTVYIFVNSLTVHI